ncbi:uncharacterized protein MONBRDRAFT_8416 [Monosiga brevicollis MX1]|uniref:Uncharacterized protein n=1 Tax=Monosiga brevicollis TaxID=81824 RepID=A9UZZ6_MONBE|nr:uncharacterized protein MONBRDRAFT_8416 [Monosiga brevicollis MX1]EDQ89065.1 predicted protein [Monosiga brevicollis MX1]|eukprot:XP_001746170.1 hypothetical protein [Monosiga brevicollis MX1]
MTRQLQGLKWALEDHNCDVVRNILLRYVPPLRAKMCHELHEMLSVLGAAIVGGPDMLNLLLEAGADPNRFFDDQHLPLQGVVGSSVDMTVALLQHNADPNKAGRSGSTAMHTAARYGRVDVLGKLIEAGGDVNKVDKSSHGGVMMQAATNGSMAVLRYLVEELGMDPSRRYTGLGTIALHGAAQQKNLEMVIRLLDAGSDVNAVNNVRLRVLQELCHAILCRFVHVVSQIMRVFDAWTAAKRNMHALCVSARLIRPYSYPARRGFYWHQHSKHVAHRREGWPAPVIEVVERISSASNLVEFLADDDDDDSDEPDIPFRLV